jgi:hypothetical protein
VQLARPVLQGDEVLSCGRDIDEAKTAVGLLGHSVELETPSSTALGAAAQVRLPVETSLSDLRLLRPVPLHINQVHTLQKIPRRLAVMGSAN